MSNTTILKFCPNNGKPHARHPTHFRACPDCGNLLHRATTPVQQPESIIVLDDTPESKKGMFVPAKTASRTVAEAARQQSIQKTARIAVRGGPAKYQILLQAYVARFETDGQTWRKFLDHDLLRMYSDPLLAISLLHTIIEKVQIQLPNVTVSNLEDLVERILVPELKRVNVAKITDIQPYLAADIQRDGITDLQDNVSHVTSLQELIELGVFKKTNQNWAIMHLVLEKHELLPTYDTEAELTPIKPRSKKAIKKEKMVKLESELRVPLVKTEPRTPKRVIKKELSFVRKRNISQLSDIQDCRSSEAPEAPEAPETPEASSVGSPSVEKPIVYGLRSRR